ncbi:E3 ubiquitin-protein ligase ubr3-like [Acropora millepora]|uniref:E3 ubiquitin-protein ligase ubr3-like n=1 Tax=Acropora millepora TaxID=45264 RepID=UPI001CF32EA4|nr:E3 ubiquitin-protein ligase ubr3-like [Acropora millepora]
MADGSSSVRAKQSTAANFKANCHTEKGKQEISGFLDGVLSLQRSFDVERQEWCLWLIAGGKRPEEFRNVLLSYDTPTICGLVWNKNFVAYRCRDCGISPCMSLCADCFHAGNHEGHDFNMFKSQAGGACDCGDEDVMKKEGFCDRHGVKESRGQSTPPGDLLAMAQIVIPRLCLRLHKQLRCMDPSLIDQVSDGMTDAEVLVNFLVQLSDTNTMKTIVAQSLMKRIVDIDTISSDRKPLSSSFSTPVLSPFERRGDTSFFSCGMSSDSFDDIVNFTFLDFLMDFVAQFEFPQKIVTFLLHLLPNADYKEAFTRVFCQNYQKIAKGLVYHRDSKGVEQLSNRIVHVSVQLFSNKILAEKVVQEQNLLHVMVKVLHEMTRPSLMKFRRGDVDSKHEVVNCQDQALVNHCYWPIVSDFINILSHKTIAKMFMQNTDLIKLWMKFIGYLTGVNLNLRKVLRHVEFEPNTYYTAFSVELEAASAPLWSFINACKSMKNVQCVQNMVSGTVEALERWYSRVSIKPQRGEVTFHLPLHRHLAAFMSLAVSHFEIPLEEVIPSQQLVRNICQELIHIQAAICEIRAGRWVRNGSQVRSQVRLYAECHFCNSLQDLDIFLLQVCAMFLDPDVLIDTMIESFSLRHWFKFGVPVVSSPPSFDVDTEASMVEGMLTLLVTLLSNRQHLGLTEQDILREEMVAQLCMADRTHSQLVDLIPDKPGQTHNTHDFDKILSELADYRGPGFESGSMQQGIYVPKDFVWEDYFDYTHVLLRAVQRQDAETSMQRYKTRLCKNGAPQSGTLWPPFRPLKPLPEKFHGLMHILHSRKLHGVLFFIFHKAVEDRNSLPEPVLYLAVYLTKLALLENTRIPHFGSRANGDRQSRDSGCVIVDRCIDFLDAYGKDIEDLHEVGNHQSLNRDLLCKLELNPHAPLDPERISPQEVSAVMADVLHSHRLMKPPLFEPFLPFMNGVLSSTLQNQSSCQEKIAQLQHIQFLIEQQVPERRQLIIKLTNHLISVSQRPQTATRISGLVGDENKPHALELSMLLMYLHRYHEWLFRSYKVPLGWPKTIDDLGFTSVNMVDNVSHVAEAVQEPMDICDSSGTPELSNNGGPSCSDEHATHSHDDQGLNIWNSASFQGIVKQFKSVTKASQDVAMNLLKACKGNLEMAINLHYNREEIMPELANAVNDVAMETSPRDLASSDAPSEKEGINQSILSLLVKLKTSMTSSCSSSPERSTACSDGLRYLSELLDTISYSSPENADALRKLQPVPTQTSSSPSSPEGDSDDLAVKALRRKLARERQQKVLAEFASKQKTFMEKNMPKDADILHLMDVDTQPTSSSSGLADEHSFDCVICGQTSTSTERRPVGLVALLQPSTVLGHRAVHVRHTHHLLRREEEETRVITCGTDFLHRYEALKSRFGLISSMEACDAGTEGGVHVQTCGHLLHVDCHQSYLKSLQGEDANQLHHHQALSFNPRNGEFTCPLCRQLGNCVVPIVPSHIIPTNTATKNEAKSHEDRTSDLHASLKKFKLHTITKLTASAWNFTVLGAAIKVVVETVSELAGESERCSADKKFSLLYRMARTNLELEQVDKAARNLSSSRKSCFGALVRAFQFHSQTLVSPLISVWSDLTGNDELKDSGTSGSRVLCECPLLLRDATSLLIQLILSWPAALSLTDFKCLVQLVFNLVFVQTLVDTCCKFGGDDKLSWQELGKKAVSQEKLPSSFSADLLLGYVCRLLGNSSLVAEDNHTAGISQSVWSPHTVERSLQDSCLTFLRSACVMASLCYDVSVPQIEEPDAEFRVLASTLGLCTPHDASSSSTESFSCVSCLKWPRSKPLASIKHWCEALLLSAMQKKITLTRELLPNLRQWPSPKLLQLPERYDSIIQHYRKRKCTKCGSAPEDPAVCLVCGKFTCLQGKCCSDALGGTPNYECIQHALDCGRGTGIFLIVLSSVIIIIRAERVCIWGSVYLDSFGEEDRDLKRGKPLFLSQERFDRLQEQWLTHSFDHMCKRWKRHMNTL